MERPLLQRTPKSILLHERDELIQNTVPYAHSIAVEACSQHMHDKNIAEKVYNDTFRRILESVEQQFWNASQ